MKNYIIAFTVKANPLQLNGMTIVASENNFFLYVSSFTALKVSKNKDLSYESKVFYLQNNPECSIYF